MYDYFYMYMCTCTCTCMCVSFRQPTRASTVCSSSSYATATRRYVPRDTAQVRTCTYYVAGLFGTHTYTCVPTCTCTCACTLDMCSFKRQLSSLLGLHNYIIVGLSAFVWSVHFISRTSVCTAHAVSSSSCQAVTGQTSSPHHPASHR